MTWTIDRIRRAATTIDQLNRTICDMYGITYTATATAPDTWPALLDSLKSDGLRHREVWNGASDKTIFDSDEQNFRARAVHDFIHLRYRHDFTPNGERATCKVQTSIMRRAANTITYWATFPCVPGAIDDAIALVRAEVAGQVEYNETHGGAFPVDQLQFALDYLNGTAPADMA